MKTKIGLFLLLIPSVFFFACSTAEKMEKIAELKRCQFSVQGVSDFQMHAPEDKITAAMNFVQGKTEIPVSFIVNVAASNPNTGKGEIPATPLTITRLPWELRFENKEENVARGAFEEPLVLPASGETKIIPMRVRLDLMKVYGNKEKLASALAAFQGAEGAQPVTLFLDLKPKIQTEYIPFEYETTVKYTVGAQGQG